MNGGSNSILRKGKLCLRNSFAWLRSTPEQLQFYFFPRPSSSSSIVVAGSGRSGTTWISDLISSETRTQQIFEPMNTVWVSSSREFIGWGEERRRVRSLYLRPSNIDPDWRLFLQNILTGQIRSWGWTDKKRTSYLPIKFLIKDIRFNMMLGYIYNQFSPKIIYIRRHPCAVIRSQLISKWDADAQDILMQEELVDDYLGPYLHRIEQAQTRLDMLAIWWGVENMVAQKQLARIPHCFVYYENMILQPASELGRIFTFLELPAKESFEKRIRDASRTSRGEIYTSASDRLSRWQRKMSKAEKKRIMRWVYMFELNDYDLSPFPLQ